MDVDASMSDHKIFWTATCKRNKPLLTVKGSVERSQRDRHFPHDHVTLNFSFVSQHEIPLLRFFSPLGTKIPERLAENGRDRQRMACIFD